MLNLVKTKNTMAVKFHKNQFFSMHEPKHSSTPSNEIQNQQVQCIYKLNTITQRGQDIALHYLQTTQHVR